MRYGRIPDEAVRRLPIYLRGLLFLAEQGRQNVSSRGLADFLGVNPWKIRKDFSYFGVFGTPGVGYKTETLIKLERHGEMWVTQTPHGCFLKVTGADAGNLLHGQSWRTATGNDDRWRFKQCQILDLE